MGESVIGSRPAAGGPGAAADQAVGASARAADAAAAADARSLCFALAGTFVLRCASYSAGTIIPIFLGLKSRTDDEITVGLASLVAVTFYGAELLGAPVFGALSDRYGRKLFMVLGPVFGGIAIQLLGFSAIIPVLVVVRVLEGLSTASSAPSTLGYLSVETAGSARLRGRIMGLYEAATVVGLASGAAVGGRLYDQFGTLAFTLVALIYVVALLLFLLVRDRRGWAQVGHHRGLLRRLANPRIMRFAPAWLAVNAVIGAWFAVGPFLATGRPDPDQLLMGGYSGTQVGLSFMVFGVLFTAGAIVWGFVMPLIGRQATLWLGIGGLALTTLTVWLINDTAAHDAPALLAALVALLALGVFVESGFTPAALAYLAEIAEEQAQDRGSVMGVYSVLLSVGQLAGGGLAGQFAGGLVAGVDGFNGLILLTALLGLVAAATVYLLGRAERHD